MRRLQAVIGGGGSTGFELPGAIPGHQVRVVGVLIQGSSQWNDGELSASPVREGEKVGARFWVEGRTMCNATDGLNTARPNAVNYPRHP